MPEPPEALPQPGSFFTNMTIEPLAPPEAPSNKWDLPEVLPASVAAPELEGGTLAKALKGKERLVEPPPEEPLTLMEEVEPIQKHPTSCRLKT